MKKPEISYDPIEWFSWTVGKPHICSTPRSIPAAASAMTECLNYVLLLAEQKLAVVEHWFSPM